jgi:hypothetical protein
MQMKSALFCDVTQCRVAIPYLRFGTTCWSHLQGSSSLISQLGMFHACLHNRMHENVRVAWHMKRRKQEGHVTQHGAVAHNAESRDLCSAPNIFRVIKSNVYDMEGAFGTWGGGGRIEMPSDFGEKI